MKPEQLRLLSVSEATTPVRIFDPKETISQVIGYLRDSNLYEAFVGEGDGIGIATIRDMLAVQNITTTKISTMSTRVPKLNPDNTISDAAMMMFEHRIRSLPVREKGKNTGQINSQSILSKLLDTDLNLKISRIMTPDPASVDSGDLVSKARSIMIKRKIDQLPILKGRELRGVITSSSIVFNLLPPPDRTMAGDWRQARFDMPVENVSSLNAVTSEASDSLTEAFHNMERNSATYSVILNLGEVQGIATHRDFMRLLVEPKSPQEPSMYLIGLPDEPFEAEVTRAKFSRIVKLLQRGISDISEARAIIKSGESNAAKKRFQVRVFISTPRHRFSYEASGYELADIFDEVSTWAKGLVARGTKRPVRKRASRRSFSE